MTNLPADRAQTARAIAAQVAGTPNWCDVCNVLAVLNAALWRLCWEALPEDLRTPGWRGRHPWGHATADAVGQSAALIEAVIDLVYDAKIPQILVARPAAGAQSTSTTPTPGVSH